MFFIVLYAPDFLKYRGQNTAFETLSPDDLARVLKEFYCCARQKKSQPRNIVVLGIVTSEEVCKDTL
jgi:hypothetical protein